MIYDEVKALQEQVARQKTVDDGAKTLIDGFAAKLQDVADNRNEVLKVVEQMRANSSALAASVSEGTAAASGNSTVITGAPSPATGTGTTADTDLGVSTGTSAPLDSGASTTAPSPAAQGDRVVLE